MTWLEPSKFTEFLGWFGMLALISAYFGQFWLFRGGGGSVSAHEYYWGLSIGHLRFEQKSDAVSNSEPILGVYRPDSDTTSSTFVAELVIVVKLYVGHAY